MTDRLIFAVRAAATLTLITLCAVVMLAVALVTLFQCRRVYTESVLAPFAHWILRLWGLRMITHLPARPAARQTVYVMNHTSTIDMFAIVALGLPNTRYFLSGFLRKFPPFALIGYLIGIFWTVDQVYSERRVRIFQRASRILARTGESVCLSPEGVRITTGDIGHFNKGAFHLAISLKAPMQPLFIHIPRQLNPGKGWHARPGTIHVYFGEPIDTSTWREEDLSIIKEDVRDLYRNWSRSLNEAHQTIN